jgi:hypothetical protein
VISEWLDVHRLEARDFVAGDAQRMDDRRSLTMSGAGTEGYEQPHPVNTSER